MDTIQASRSGGSEEMQAAKLKFSTLRDEKNVLLQERNKISAELKVHQAKGEKQFQSQKALRQEIKYTTSSEIEEQIQKLRYQQETQSMSLQAEKKIIKEIESLQQSKKLVSKFASDKDAIEKCRGNVKEIRALHNKKNLEIDAVQEKLSAQKKVLDALYAAMKEQDNRDAVPKLLEERKTIKAQVDEKYNAIRVMRSEFKDKNDAYYNYVRAQREAKKEEMKAEQELIQAEYEKKMEEYNKELAKIHPYQTEMDLCDALVKYLQSTFAKDLKIVSSTAAATESCCVMKDLDGMKPLKREEEDFFAGFGGKKGGKKTGKKAVKKETKLSLPLAQMDSFSQLGLFPPSTVTALKESVKAIEERKTFYEAQKERPDAPKAKAASKPATSEETTTDAPMKSTNENKKQNKKTSTKSKKFNAGVADFPSLGDDDASKQAVASTSTWGPSATIIPPSAESFVNPEEDVAVSVAIAAAQ